MECPISVSAVSMSDEDNLNDAVNISLKFKTVQLNNFIFLNGSKGMAERVR